MTPLDYTKLSPAQKRTIDYLHEHLQDNDPYCFAMKDTFSQVSAKWLQKRGWLAVRWGVHAPKYTLTDAGRATYEAAQQQPAQPDPLDYARQVRSRWADTPAAAAPIKPPPGTSGRKTTQGRPLAIVSEPPAADASAPELAPAEVTELEAYGDGYEVGMKDYARLFAELQTTRAQLAAMRVRLLTTAWIDEGDFVPQPSPAREADVLNQIAVDHLEKERANELVNLIVENSGLQATIQTWRNRADDLEVKNAELRVENGDLRAQLAASQEREARLIASMQQDPTLPDWAKLNGMLHVLEAELEASQEREASLRAALSNAYETLADISGISADNIEHYDNLYPDEIQDVLVDLQRRADGECDRVERALEAAAASEEASDGQ